MIQKVFPKLGSSQDSEQLALRAKTLLLALVPVAVYASGLAGWDIGEESWHQVAEFLIEAINALVLLYAAIMHIWGWVRALKK